MKTVMALIALLTLFLFAGCSKPCPTCNGTGKVISLGALSISCPTCEGTGKVKSDFDINEFIDGLGK